MRTSRNQFVSMLCVVGFGLLPLAARAEPSPVPVTEFTTFKLTPKATPEQVAAAFRKADEAFARSPGFVSRQLFFNEEQRTCLLLLTWRSAAEAEQAGDGPVFEQLEKDVMPLLKTLSVEDGVLRELLPVLAPASELVPAK